MIAGAFSGMRKRTITIYTLGHSTRPIDEFLRIMDAFRIRSVVDVRKISSSRHNPQYDEKALERALSEHGIGYVRLKCLGGLRKPTGEATNAAWRNLSFRGYADYMQTREFEECMLKLVELATKDRIAIMCAESVPWRCHRSLIGDALLARGFEVIDIFDEKHSKPHKMTSFANVEGTRVTYPEKDEKEK